MRRCLELSLYLITGSVRKDKSREHAVVLYNVLESLQYKKNARKQTETKICSMMMLSKSRDTPSHIRITRSLRAADHVSIKGELWGTTWVSSKMLSPDTRTAPASQPQYPHNIINQLTSFRTEIGYVPTRDLIDKSHLLGSYPLKTQNVGREKASSI